MSTNTYLNFCYQWCVSISVLHSLFGIPVDISSSGIELKICEITAAITRYKLKKEKEKEKVVKV